jgi:hypothetical protein
MNKGNKENSINIARIISDPKRGFFVGHPNMPNPIQIPMIPRVGASNLVSRTPIVSKEYSMKTMLQTISIEPKATRVVLLKLGI